MDPVVQTIALTMGVAWASGINLYAAVFMLGYMGMTGHMELPPDLQQHNNLVGVQGGAHLRERPLAHGQYGETFALDAKGHAAGRTRRRETARGETACRQDAG